MDVLALQKCDTLLQFSSFRWFWCGSFPVPNEASSVSIFMSPGWVKVFVGYSSRFDLAFSIALIIKTLRPSSLVVFLIPLLHVWRIVAP